MNKKLPITALAAALALLPCAASDGGTFTNPVTTTSLPDPTVIRADDGYFYLYATEDVRNLPIYRSANLTEWTFVGTAFTDATRPKWNADGGIWAPDINRIGGKYVLYYSKSVWGGEWTCGIGVATADRPEGPFTDHGALFTSREIGVQNSIDPFFISDEGRNYLFWGSFHGIYGIELTADGLAVKPGAEKKKVAANFMEGTYIYRRGQHYYLFGSAGSCCEGARSTYRVTYGRAESLFGPYYTKSGDRLLDGDYDTLVSGDSLVAGPGHNAEIVTDDEGNDWMPMHGYQRSDPDAGRVTWLERIDWRDGWPEAAGGTVAKTQPKPVFGQIHLADPTIYAENGTYYLYGTTPKPDEGFWVYTSTDLTHWTGPAGRRDGFALDGNTYGSNRFWAPQVFKRGDTYYMAYCANEHIAIASSRSPLGPFVQHADTTWRIQSKVREIDPYVFTDTDGKAYLYHVRLDRGNRIYVVELDDNLMSVRENTARECIHAEGGWENAENAEWPVCEGPTVVKVGSTYYMFYSCNDFRSKSYAVGYATASTPLGPWKKEPKPLIAQSNTGMPGTGHGDLLRGKDGQWMYVMHTHDSEDRVSPRRTAIVGLRLKGKRWEVVPGSFRFITRDGGK